MKTGLCLAGGGVKGAAHIGALKAFEEEQISFEYISGTSSGSIVASLYAMGFCSDEIYDIFKKYSKKIKYIDWKNVYRFIKSLIIKRKIYFDGFNSGDIIENTINKMAKQKGITTIKEIRKNLIIPSVDVNSGNIYVFLSKLNRAVYSDKMIYNDSIPIGKAVRASCSYPGVFSPCEFNNKQLVDGGIRENIPWKEIKKNGADKVICIIFEKELKRNKCENIIEVITNSIDILGHELELYEINGADYFMKIKSKNISLLDVSKIEELYELGYQVVKQNITKMKQKKLI